MPPVNQLPNMNMVPQGYPNPNQVYPDSYQMNPSISAPMGANPNMPTYSPQQNHMMGMPVDSKLQQFKPQQTISSQNTVGQVPSMPDHYMSQAPQQVPLQYAMSPTQLGHMHMNNQLYMQQQHMNHPPLQQQTYGLPQPVPQYQQPVANIQQETKNEAQLISFD